MLERDKTLDKAGRPAAYYMLRISLAAALPMFAEPGSARELLAVISTDDRHRSGTPHKM